jgi:dienelactone hydrolase
MTTTIAPTKPVSIPHPRRRWWSLPDSLWSGLSRGFALGVVILMLAFAVWDKTTGWLALDLLMWGLAGVLWLALFDGVVSLLLLAIRGVARVVGAMGFAARVKRFRTSLVSWPIAGVWLTVVWLVFPDSPLAAVTSTIVGTLFVLSMAIGGAIYGHLRHRWPRVTWLQLTGGLLIPMLTVLWLLWPGPGVIASLRADVNHPAVASAPNPGLSGPFPTGYFTYGSGSDRRDEFGTHPEIVTPTVDGTGIWSGFGGPAGWWWETYWGFGLDTLPLNGRVWYPVGDGPYPLVLIVHGNHAAGRFSDPGYAYLGEHLASFGYIAVSVDENFLNGNLLGDPLGKEMPLRAWLLTEHVAQWDKWNSEPGFVLASRVDLDRVGVVGHSRGGEAAALAAAMLQRDCAPVDGRINPSLEDNRISAVVAVAPSDASYLPCGLPAELQGTSYLTINGAMDADVGTFYGLAQYGRTHVEDPRSFKAYAYLHRANHGQFNSLWGYGDLGLYDWLVLDRASLMTAAEQQQSAKVLITAFLQASLRAQNEYRDLFQSPDDYAVWLPNDLLVTRYSDGELQVIDGQRASIEAAVNATGFVTNQNWRLTLRADGYSQYDYARMLVWESGPASLAYEFTTPLRLTAGNSVTFDLTSASDDYRPRDITVTLVSADDTEATVLVDVETTLRPPLETHLLKVPGMPGLGDFENWTWLTERVLQTYEIPIEAFTAANPRIDLSAVVELRFDLIDPSGVVLIDEVGLRG